MGSALHGKIILAQKEPKQRYQSTKEQDTFREMLLLIGDMMDESSLQNPK